MKSKRRELPYIKPVLLGAGALLFFIGGALSSSTLQSLGANQQLLAAATTAPVRLKQSEYPLINPLLLCDVGNSTESTQNKDLRKKISTFIDDRIAQDKVLQMSVYLQRYGGGGWVGINDKDVYAPASLLKVPLMIAYYKIGEANPGFLDKRIQFKGLSTADPNSLEHFKSFNNIKVGISYSIDELIQHMIGGSDNTATTILQNAMDTATREDTYNDLGLATPPNDPSTEYMSVTQYAYFFRILYNATYLNREYSQRALTNLSQSDFVQGIRAGVPQDVIVAQKFGERTVLNPDGSVARHELHDCGIIYKKNANYLLCIMSKGKDFDQMARNIADLSKLVYAEVSLPPSPTPN